jgi:XTP/dITP diphosphohydrolase
LARKLLLATNNSGKAAEYRSLLAGLDLELITLREAGIVKAVAETGQTMEENARLKATVYAAASGVLSLADDSGLEVDALGGEPGHLSARYGGDSASDADRVNHLLARMAGLPRERRSARFRCIIAVSTPAGVTAVSEGECTGTIAFEPRGSYGFGYDPVFYLPDLGRTMAELTPREKDAISHRAMAARGVPGLLLAVGAKTG